MEIPDLGNAPLPAGADDPRMVEVLTRWDELTTEDHARVAAHPVHGPRLRLLEEAEAWFTSQAAEASPCPAAEELFDFAHGPGYEPMSSARRGRIEDHLALCSECESLVEGLATAPPAPLVLSEQSPAPATYDPAPAPAPAPARAPTPDPVRPLRRLDRWAPLLVAAGLLFAIVVFRSAAVDAGDRWPNYPLLRGSAADALLFPRDRVLDAESLPGETWAAAPRFELTPVADAASYRIRLRSHSGSAFAPGETVFQLEGALPELSREGTLPAGHYTWEAWVVVDGLERLLGERDFEVAFDPSIAGTLAALPPIDQIHTLHDTGYWTDARERARHMAAGPGRDEYLGAKPGR